MYGTFFIPPSLPVHFSLPQLYSTPPLFYHRSTSFPATPRLPQEFYLSLHHSSSSSSSLHPLSHTLTTTPQLECDPRSEFHLQQHSSICQGCRNDRNTKHKHAHSSNNYNTSTLIAAAAAATSSVTIHSSSSNIISNDT